MTTRGIFIIGAVAAVSVAITVNVMRYLNRPMMPDAQAQQYGFHNASDVQATKSIVNDAVKTRALTNGEFDDAARLLASANTQWSAKIGIVTAFRSLNQPDQQSKALKLLAPLASDSNIGGTVQQVANAFAQSNPGVLSAWMSSNNLRLQSVASAALQTAKDNLWLRKR